MVGCDSLKVVTLVRIQVPQPLPRNRTFDILATNMQKIIVFDFDGVLFDTIDFARENLANIFIGFTKEMHHELMMGNFHEEIKKVTLPKKQETEEEEAKRKATFTKTKSEASMYPGTREFLKEMYAFGFTLVLNTSAYDRNSRPLLEKAEIDSLFDFITTAETSKSKVEKFKIISEKYNIKNEDLIFVTDTIGDIREADEAGVPTIAVTWGGHDRTYLTREKHDNVLSIVDSFDELKAFITTK